MSDMPFAERLRLLRKERGLTQEELASELWVSKQAISNYENGREPMYPVLRAMAKFFGVTTDFLLAASDLRDYKDGCISEELGFNAEAIDVIRTLKKNKDKLTRSFCT